VVSHAQPSYGGPARLPPSARVATSDSWSSGPSFFGRLFGMGPPTPPAPVGRRPRPLYQQQGGQGGGFFTR
jgi:L,D-transpeptidase YcbB